MHATRPHLNPRNFRFAIEAVLIGTATAGGASTITLAVGSSAVDDFYNRLVIVITGGTGKKGEIRQITNYVGGTLVATVDAPWTTAPDATTTYAIYRALSREPFISTLAAVSAADRTVTLNDRESIRDDCYNQLDITMLNGAANPRTNTIIDYTGSSRLAQLAKAWDIAPSAGDLYSIQGHLYFPVSAILGAETGGSAVMRFSSSPGGLAFGAYTKGTQIDEDDLGGMNYLEIAMDGAASTMEITRWE